MLISIGSIRLLIHVVKPSDTENFVSLVKEMRAAFGTKYGISLTLAPDYWYLRYFDAIAMEPYVDWSGFMA